VWVMGESECEERSGEGTRRDQEMDERAHPLAFCHDLLHSEARTVELRERR